MDEVWLNKFSIVIGVSGKYGFLKIKFKYFEASSVILSLPFSSNCQIAIAVNNFDMDAVLYSSDVLFSVPSLFNLVFPIDLQNNVLLSFITAKPPVNNGASFWPMIDSIFLLFHLLSN